MHTRRHRDRLRSTTALAAVAGVLSTSGTVRAQTQPSPAAAAEARGHSAAGTKLQKLGLCEAAIPEFEQAFKLAGRPADLFSAIDCRKSLGDLTGAYEDLDLLAAAPGLSARDKTAVTAARGDLDARTGSLDVSAPVGATVEVDGRPVGTAPLQHPLHLLAGAHAVRVTASGSMPWMSAVQIVAGQKASLSAQLQPVNDQGHVFVRAANGAAVHVFVDGQDVGAAPWDGDLPPGTHTVSLKAPGFASTEQQLQVSAHQQQALTLAARATTGHVQVSVVPRSASIEIDGKAVGAGSFDGDVEAGQHVLRVSAPGFKADERNITVDPQTTQSANVLLDRYVSPEEIARQQAEREAAAYRGGYGQVALFGNVGVANTHLTCDQVPTDIAANTCTPNLVFGGGLSVHGGYSFGLIGLEGTILLVSSYWKDDVTYRMPSNATAPPNNTNLADVTHDEEYTWLKLGGVVGVGPRLTTPGKSVRFTVGAAGGLSIKGVFLSRSVSNGLSESPSYSDSALVLAPAVTGDLGLTIGSVPGASFSFGAMAWADFPSSTQVTPGGKSVTEVPQNGSSFSGKVGPFTAESGPQVYVGPYFGIRFGH